MEYMSKPCTAEWLPFISLKNDPLIAVSSYPPECLYGYGSFAKHSKTSLGISPKVTSAFATHSSL